MQTIPRSRSRQADPFRRVDPGSRLPHSPRLSRNALSATISAILATGALPMFAQAAAPADDIPEIIVTATRRAEDIQDIPLNIAAVSGENLEKQGIADLASLGRSVPGLYVVDQGKRTSNQIVVRGLNVESVGAQDSAGNDGGDIVSTYIGEIPLYVDLRLEDMERVEVLLGPQGTLYGVGTMGGAIRYLPRRPQFDETTLTVRGSGYSLAESDDVGLRGGFTFNTPLSDILAFRASLDYIDDPGFIDQPFVVREAGLSDPEPNDPADIPANLRRVDDTNYEKTWAGRAGLRLQAAEGIEVNLTHYFQNMDVGGRNLNSVAAFGTGPYESAVRYLEPNKRINRLTSLEITADLGFAELTSATGKGKYHDNGQRDQTDLLITLEYSYEFFPTFSAFTRDWENDETFSQELRLVSKDVGPLSWIGGLFYRRLDVLQESKEFTPHYDDYLASILGGTGRPDDLEYWSFGEETLTEKALYGEIGYEINDQWQVTVGGRLYKYDDEVLSGYDTPVLGSALGVYGPDETGLVLEASGQDDSGSLFKFNTSYKFTPDLMGYLTVSEGYRIGGNNGIAPCPDPLPSSQELCALPDEVQYAPDKTVNYELGVHSEWLGGALTLNGAVFFIDWQDPQLQSSTANGSLPYTKNGQGAESKGIEISFDSRLTDSWSLRGSYSYVQAELSDVAPDLIRVFTPPGFGPSDPAEYVDGQAGDRLPGSPEQQATLFTEYDMTLASDWSLRLQYGLSYTGDIITRAGLRGEGETLGGFTLHSAAATLSGGPWSVSLYAQNLFNKFAITGTRSRRSFIQEVSDDNGDIRRVRSYGEDVLRPREVGLRFSYDFEL